LEHLKEMVGLLVIYREEITERPWESVGTFSYYKPRSILVGNNGQV
jgi:hypothetical protein